MNVIIYEMEILLVIIFKKSLKVLMCGVLGRKFKVVIDIRYSKLVLVDIFELQLV